MTKALLGIGAAMVALAATAVLALAAATPDVTVLAPRVEKLVHSQRQFRKAVLLQAGGGPAALNHKVKTAGGIVKWNFVFDNRKTGGKYKSATVTAVRGKFGKVTGSTQPVLDDQDLKPVPKMTLTRAVSLLRKAGYTHGFYWVALRKVLYPGVKDASYIFTVASGKYVSVNTRTGKVIKLN